MKTLKHTRNQSSNFMKRGGGEGGCRRHILQWFSYKIVPKLLMKGGGGAYGLLYLNLPVDVYSLTCFDLIHIHMGSI